MTVQRALLVNGTDLATLFIVNRLDLFIPGERKGAPDPKNGANGSWATELPLASYAFSAQVTVAGATEWEMIANLAAASVIISGTNGRVPLARRLPTSSSTYMEHTADGMFFSGMSFALLDTTTGQTELQFLNCDGAWTPDGGTTWLTY